MSDDTKAQIENALHNAKLSRKIAAEPMPNLSKVAALNDPIQGLELALSVIDQLEHKIKFLEKENEKLNRKQPINMNLS